jgi:hypothetical protein
MVSVAVPWVKTRNDPAATRLLWAIGVGLLVVQDEAVHAKRFQPFSEHLRAMRRERGCVGPDETPEEESKYFHADHFTSGIQFCAPFRRRVAFGLKEALHEEQKTFAPAGSRGGKHWTPYKSTCRALLAEVKQEPGISLRDALGKITHHYASATSARACLARLVEEGLVPGVRLTREEKEVRLYPA